MAIDENQPIRQVTVQRGNTTVLIRHGIENGNVVVEDDGVIRPATQAEIDNYHSSNAAEAEAANIKSVASNVAGVSGGLPDIKAYLALKFPEDFN